MGGVMGAGIVFLIGGPLVGSLTESGGISWMNGLEPWRQAFILTGVPGIFLALLIFFFRETRQPAPAQAGGQVYGEALRYIGTHWRYYLSVFLGISVVYAATIGLQMWSPAYFERVHGWDKGTIGMYMGIAQILAALSLPLHGWIVDQWFKRGMKSAHLVWCALNALVGAAIGIAAYLVASPMMGIVLFGAYMVTGMAAAGLGPALVQIATPAHLRGRISALFVVCTGLISMGLGPSLVGFVTDYIMGDEAKVGWSMILTLFVLLPLAAFILSIGRSRLEGLLAANAPKPAQA
jgi:MFS family permease